MEPVAIENPVVNSPFEEPRRHFEATDAGMTGKLLPGRRLSEHLTPVPPPKKRGAQLQIDAEWAHERHPNELVNRIRARVRAWREGGYQDVTDTTLRLLKYWQQPDRNRPLFFCQIEAVETAIYLTEVARKPKAAAPDASMWEELEKASADANPGLLRMALKMATGSGKTLVMAMLIAWQTLNKLALTRSPQGKRDKYLAQLFTDAFLIITPGITIRDRLRVLLPGDPQNYYREHDLVPPEDRPNLGSARIVITNFHSFQQRETMATSSLGKKVLRTAESGAFTETPEEMVRRVCGELGGGKEGIIVINDEAHHCYRHRIGGGEEQVRLTGEERREADQQEEYARVWISGLEAVQAKLGVRLVYDLSATPFFLHGSGYKPGDLFPWVVSDFSLVDAIESGIVKVPRVPVEDNRMLGEVPQHRYFWPEVREHLPKKGRAKAGDDLPIDPEPPTALETALRDLYRHYREQFEWWEEKRVSAEGALPTPPVFIIVCNNTSVSKLVLDWVAGYDKPGPDEQLVPVPGKLELFSNVRDGRWLDRPVTLLIDSRQLESGEALSPEFKKIAAREIEEYKAEYRLRFPGADVEKLDDSDVLREVMNTVGKPGKLGEQVRCVVSVSMLTEGWDANTVTHILGVRAFGTQLLCEQVVGRALRRRSYAVQDCSVEVNGETVSFKGFATDYAEVYGVPFRFIPTSDQPPPPPPPPGHHVFAVEERREACEITFPRVMGYRYDLPEERLSADFSADSRLELSTALVPTKTENAPIIGESVILSLDDLKRHREQEVAFLLARDVLLRYFRDEQDGLKAWVFPQLVPIARRWMTECLVCKDHCFPQMLLLVQLAHDAGDRIYKAIVAADAGPKRLQAILWPYNREGSTEYVDFTTTRNVWPTRPDKCHLNLMVADTETWEQKLAQELEGMDEVFCYVKNHNLGFTIPYTVNGQGHDYVPDFIALMDDGHGREDPLKLLIEVTGAQREHKQEKVATARTLWVPAVNNHGGFGRWAFVEVRDPWDCLPDLHNALQGTPEQTVAAEH